MATRYQTHHITYQPHEWTVMVNMLMHRTISRVQITKATPEAYAGLTNFLHAVSYEHNRMRQELDVGVDLRQLKPKGEKKRKVKKAAKRPDSLTRRQIKKSVRKIKRRDK